MKSFKKGISLVINTKNEEKNIADCISSTKDLVNEIVVVDMKSTDNTVLIAKKLGARVYSIKDYGIVDPARNEAIKRASFEWVLLLDADERIRNSLKRKLLKISKNNKYTVVRIPRKNIIFDKWIRHTFWWPDYQERFFKIGYIDWPKGIHEPPISRGNVLTLKSVEQNALLHMNYKDIDQFLGRMIRYTSHERNLEKMPNLTAKDAVAFFESEFTNRFFLQKGYKDGLHGYFLSKFMEFYRLVEIARFWERNKYKDIVNPDEIYRMERKRKGWSFSESASNSLRKQVTELNYTLSQIKASKFFKVWQFYCKIRDSVLDKLQTK